MNVDNHSYHHIWLWTFYHLLNDYVCDMIMNYGIMNHYETNGIITYCVYLSLYDYSTTGGSLAETSARFGGGNTWQTFGPPDERTIRLRPRLKEK